MKTHDCIDTKEEMWKTQESLEIRGSISQDAKIVNEVYFD